MSDCKECWRSGEERQGCNCLHMEALRDRIAAVLGREPDGNV